MTESSRPTPVILLIGGAGNRKVITDEFTSRYARDYDIITSSVTEAQDCARAA